MDRRAKLPSEMPGEEGRADVPAYADFMAQLMDSMGSSRTLRSSRKVGGKTPLSPFPTVLCSHGKAAES